MRLLFPVLALPLLIPAATLAQAPTRAVESPQNQTKALAATNSNCRQTTAYQAQMLSERRGDPIAPRKLTELPPAVSYKAVYRRVNGCEEPMTVAEYQRTVVR